MIHLHVAQKIMHSILNIIVPSKWLCWSTDIKLALLQNRNVVKVVYVQPPKKRDCQDTTLWKLSTTIYRLKDVSRSWHLNIKKELIGLGTIVCTLYLSSRIYMVLSIKSR